MEKKLAIILYMVYFEKQIEKYKEVMTPAIIQIPGVKGNTGDGIRAVRRSVEQAVGSDILFGE